MTDLKERLANACGEATWLMVNGKRVFQSADGLYDEAIARIEELERENERLHSALAVERAGSKVGPVVRFHSVPEDANK